MIYMKVEIDKDFELTVRAQRAALKSTWDAIGRLWQKDFLPKHFTTQAYARYGYERRATSTLKKKKAQAAKGKVESGGLLPLVHSGLMRRALTGFTQRQSAYPSRVTIHLVGPSYLTTNYKPGRPHMAREIMAVSTEEREAIAKFTTSTLRENSLAEFKKQRVKRTIKSS